VLTSLFSESHMNFIEQKNWIGIAEKLFLTNTLDSFFHKRLGAIQKSKFFGNHYELIEKNIVISIKSGGYDDMNELYIRFGTFSNDEKKGKQIIIARIFFNEKKQKRGNGVSLLLTLCEIAEKFDYKIIRFEAPNKNCRAFCKRLGFSDSCSISRTDLIFNLNDYLFKKSAEKYLF
jgi:hypothetical protein